MEVAIGVDPSKGSLAVAAVDPLGRVLGVREFTNDPAGHRLLVRWVGEHRTTHHRDRGVPELRGRRGLSFAGRGRRRPGGLSLAHPRGAAPARQGKSDPIDAVAIARVVAADETLPSTRRAALLSDLKLLVDHRDQLVRARTQMANRAHADLVVIRPGYEQTVPNLRARRHVAKARSLISRDRSVRADLVRRRLGEVLRLEAEIAKADRDIADEVAEANTTLTHIPGDGPFIAAKILGEVGEV